MSKTFVGSYVNFVAELKVLSTHINEPVLQLAFCCSAIQNLLPTYAKFQRNSGWGGFVRVYQLAQYFWNHCESTSQITKAAPENLSSIGQLCADSEATYLGEPIYNVEFAQSICSSLELVLNFINGNSESPVVNVGIIELNIFEGIIAAAKLSQGDYHQPRFITPESNALFDDEIWNSKLLQLVISRQFNTLEKLSTIAKHKSGLSEFIRENRRSRSDVLGISFDDNDLKMPTILDRVNPDRSISPSIFLAKPDS